MTNLNFNPRMKVYFKNLDAIRFIAAFLVILHHAQFYKTESGLSSWPVLDRIMKETGRMGVNLFFVLSGFLISYLLLKENKETGSINFRSFYIRRILRIWPLYLAYSISLIFLIPYLMNVFGMGSGYDTHTVLINLLFMLLFAVNIQLAFFPYNKGIMEVTWSVCIEEQFYLLWPVLILAFRNRLKHLFILMLSIGFLSKTLCLVLPYFFDVSSKKLFSINYVLLFDKLELFGMGMFAAYLLFNKEIFSRLMAALMNRWLQGIMLVLTILVVFSIIRISWLSETYYDHFIHAILFGYLMLMAVAPNSILHLEYPLMKTLGKISYGVYLFHGPVCQLVLISLQKVFGHAPDILAYEILFPALSVVFTCGIAYISYEFFEKHFLRIKSRFAVVQTRY